MDTRPIGMFDSGVGGLTVLTEVRRYCANEDIIYLGDTERFPYGNKSKESIIEITRACIEFLINKNVKAVIIACGTATSQALEVVKDEYDIPIIGIINEASNYIKEKEYKRIGVIATSGTIRSKGWESKIKEYVPDAIILNKACPLLAPMAEEGWTENEVAKLTIREYLKQLHDIECLVLGCTHYPLFKKVIEEELGTDKDLINAGEVLAKKLRSILEKTNLQNESKKVPDYEIYLTDTETNFVDVASKLLQDDTVKEKIRKANIKM